MHHEICNLILEIKANQEQVMEFASRQATVCVIWHVCTFVATMGLTTQLWRCQFAEHSLLTGNIEAGHSYLNDVRDLASARPNNMTAAKEVLEVGGATYVNPAALLAALINSWHVLTCSTYLTRCWQPWSI